MLELLLSPTSWQQRLATLQLGPDAALPELYRQRRHPEIRRLLWHAIGIEPLLGGMLVLAVLSLFTWEWKYLQLGLVCSVVWHLGCLLWLGFFGSFAAARVTGMLGGLAMGLSLGGLHSGFLILVALLFVAVGAGLAECRRQIENRHALIGHSALSVFLLWAGYQGGIALVPGDPFAGSLLGISLALGLGLGAAQRSWRAALGAGAGMMLAAGAFLGSAFLPESGLPHWLVYALSDAALSGILASLLSGLAALPPVSSRAGGRGSAYPAILLLSGVYALLAYSHNAPPWMYGLGLGALLLGVAYPWWLPVLVYPCEEIWNYACYFLDRHAPTRPVGGRFARHSVWWHQRQYLPRHSLRNYLVWLWECGIQYEALLAAHSWLHRAVKLECDTRVLEAARTAPQLGECHARLSGNYAAHDPHASLLRRFQMFSRDLAAAQAQSDNYRQRLLLLDVEERLHQLGIELQRQRNHTARRFLALAAAWREAVRQAADDLAALSVRRREIRNPYIVGIPLTTKESVFIERPRTLARIEKLLQDRHCPPILLYGQRRTGKTSLLHNLSRLMSSRLLFVYLDFQSPRFMSGDVGVLLDGIAGAIRRAHPELPSFTRDHEAAVAFDAWLERVENVLAGRTLLVAMDEFVVLEEARRRGQLPEAALFTLLNTLRHIIQHRRQIRLLLAGSHTLDELHGWAGYLINAQVVHMGYLTADETRHLVERPLPGFALRYTPEALARMLKSTAGHPALVQLLCSELVEYKNSQAEITYTAELADVEAALEEALHSGNILFSDLAYNQIDAEALALAVELARQGEDALLPAAAIVETRRPALAQLLKREIFTAHGDGYRFQVEMIRRGMLSMSNEQ